MFNNTATFEVIQTLKTIKHAQDSKMYVLNINLGVHPQILHVTHCYLFNAALA